MMEKIKLPNDKFAAVKMGGGIRDIVDLANRLEKSGRKVYHLEIGRPDFDSPSIAKEATKKALDEGLVHYADMRGVEELRVALSEKLKRENGVEADPGNILVTVGAQAAITTTMLVALNAGDEVVVPTPCFGSYPAQCSVAGARFVPVPCRIEDEFILKASDLESRITDKTRMILINTPNNPTGAVMAPGEIEKIAELAKRHDLLVLSDECYERFLYGGEHVSIGSLPGMSERAVTVGAASKTYSMTGWRVGYMAMPSWMTAYANRAHLILNTCVTTFTQYGYAEALRRAEGDVQAMIREYRERRDLVVDCLRQMPSLDFVVPDGAFYIFPSVARTGLSATAFCNYMLEEAGVALVPGEAFEMPGFVRLAYCKSKDYLADALSSMKAAMDKLGGEQGNRNA